MMLRRPIDVAVLVQSPQAVLHAVVVHEVQHLLPRTRRSEAAGMRDTRCKGEYEHGENRDEGGGCAETHAEQASEPSMENPSDRV